MKKLFMLLCCLFAVACQSHTAHTVFPNTPFTDGTYHISGKHGFQKLIIENGKVFLTFDGNVNVLLKNSGLSGFYFEKDKINNTPSPTEPTLQWYTTGVAGHQSKYGSDYFVFHHPTLSQVANEKTFVLRLHTWDVLIFKQVDAKTFTDQYGNTYTKN